ncbi:hypothetical protein HWV62_41729 [Athelia sp. TMB]|nr:hypothetical protein HWV62_41729 [Athelia sp. TMB]
MVITLVTRPCQFASTSRGQWHARNYAIWDGLRDKLQGALTPKPREQETQAEIDAARQKQKAEGTESFFDTPAVSETVADDKTVVKPVGPKKKHTEHKYSTANFKISHRKLNDIGRQISGKPIDYAILQMQFSEKRASRRIKSTLVMAKQHAINYKGLDPSKLVVSESWVSKGPRSVKRLEPRGRSHYGIRTHPDSRLTVVLREGKTFVEKKEKQRQKKLRAVISAGQIREDVPLRNPGPMWDALKTSVPHHTMSQRWTLLLLGLVAPAISLASQSFENTAIVRTVELGGSLVHVTTTYAVKALEAGSSVYTVAIGTQQKERTSWAEAKIKGQANALELQDKGCDAESNTCLYDVHLPKALAADGSITTIVFGTIETHATYPWPPTARQDDEQKLKYDTNLFIVSPYHTAVQRTKIKAPSNRVLSYTTPENLDAFTLESPVTKSGTTVTYGPYNNIAPSANSAFIEAHQATINIHYHYDYPVLAIMQYKRAAEISHWGANLNIQDEIHLNNAGPTLKGQFSRLQHQTQSFYQRAAPHVLSSMNLHLPAGISNAYFYDLNGNVSTSHLRSTPSTARNAKTAQYSLFEMKPRYPIMGGWNYSFTLGWDSPLADSGSWDAKNQKYIVAVPVMTLFPSAVIDNAELKIILPEGATDVEVITPFPALETTTSTHVTYLDTTGRPAVTFQYGTLTDKHNQLVYVTYKVPFSAHLKKPLAVATAFLSLFGLALAGRRINLSLHKN